MSQSISVSKVLGLCLAGALLFSTGFAQKTKRSTKPAPKPASATAPAKQPAPKPAAAPATGDLLGKPLPDANVNDVMAKTLSLAQFKGKPTVISFWATWCSPCLEEMPAFSKLVEDYQGKLQVLAIAVGDTRDDSMAFIARHPDYKLTWLLDPEGDAENTKLVQAFGIIGLPTNMFIDADGKVVDYWRGLANNESLIKRIQGLMAR